MDNRTIAALLGVAAVGVVTTTVGFSVGWITRGPSTVEVPRSPTDAELAEACAPEVDAVEDQLTAAQTKVAALERTAAEKERRVVELEAKMRRGAEVGQELRAEIDRLKSELAEAKEELRIANEEKDRLLVELVQTQEELADTKEELVVTRVQRDEAREDAIYNRWQGFLKNAQLDICEKGNRKKLGNCRESVMAALDAPERSERFAHCLRSGQAQPMVRELDKDATLPQFAEMLDEDVKQVKGWFVDFCDPTLPEISDPALAEGRLPPGGQPG